MPSRRTRIGWPALYLLPHHQHALSIQTDAAVPAGLAAHADRRPYDGPDIVRAYAHQPDWTDFGPGYVEAMTYDFDVLAGYLKRHADRDL